MKKKVWKATLLVFVLSLAAKLIAFFKSIIQAAYFGTTQYTDAYNVSFGFVANILYMFTTAIAVAFVPLYIRHKSVGREEGKKFASRVITFLLIFSVFITFILLLIAPGITTLIAPSYKGDIRQITIQYFRVMVLGFSFSLVANIYTNLLDSEKIYGFSTFGSIINSFILIAFIFLFSEQMGVWSLVVAVPVSYMAQWVMLYTRGRKYGSITFKYGLRDDSIKILIAQATPILISQATVEINQVVDRALLSSIGEGALTAVSYSTVLFQFASQLMQAPLQTVMFTELSEAGAKNDDKEISNILSSSYKLLIVLCVPVMMLIYFCGYDIVDIVYGHGRFSNDAVLQAAIGLEYYSFCLLPIGIKTVLSRAYYAKKDTVRPMILGMVEVAINITLSILFVKPFGIKGVVGATSIASVVMIIVMLVDFNRKYINAITMSSVKTYNKIFVGIVAVVIELIALKKCIFINSLLDFTIKTVIVFGTYFLILLALKDPSIISLWQKIKRKVTRN